MVHRLVECFYFPQLDRKTRFNVNRIIKSCIVKLMCAEDYVIGLFGSYEFVGTAITCLIIPPLADSIGRKYFSLCSMWITVGVLLALILTQNHYIYYGALFFNGICIGLKQVIFYTHIMEFLNDKQSFLSGFFFFMDGGVFTVSPLMLYFIRRNTDIFIYFSMFLSVTTMILIHLVIKLPESLKFNLSKHKYEEFLRDLDYVLKYNGEGQEMIEREENEIVKNLEKVGFIGILMQTPHGIYNMALISMGWTTSTFVFFLLDFFVKYLPGNIYVNQLIASISMVGYLFAEPTANRTKQLVITKLTNNRVSLTLSYVVSLAAVVIMTFVHGLNEYVFAVIFLILKMALCWSFSSLYMIHIDIFPTQILSTSYGFANFVCRMLTFIIIQTSSYFIYGTLLIVSSTPCIKMKIIYIGKGRYEKINNLTTRQIKYFPHNKFVSNIPLIYIYIILKIKSLQSNYKVSKICLLIFKLLEYQFYYEKFQSIYFLIIFSTKLAAFQLLPLLKINLMKIYIILIQDHLNSTIYKYEFTKFKNLTRLFRQFPHILK